MRTTALLVALALAGCETPLPKEVVKAELEEAPAFARVTFSLEGCTSCAPCRSTIRQVFQSTSAAEQISFGEGYTSARMVYLAPREIPLRSIYTGVLSSGLNDVSIAEVVLEADGAIEERTDGRYFVMGGTRQQFRVMDFPVNPASGRVIHLKAAVQGLDGEGVPVLLAPKS